MKLLTWLQGKKTYIAAGILLALGIFGLWSDQVDDFYSTSLIILAFGLMGLGARANRHASMIADAVEALKQEIQVRQPLTPEQKKKLMQDGAELATELAGADPAPPPPQLGGKGGLPRG